MIKPVQRKFIRWHMESNIDDQILLNRKLISHEDRVPDTWLLLLREIRKAGLGAKKAQSEASGD